LLRDVSNNISNVFNIREDYLT